MNFCSNQVQNMPSLTWKCFSALIVRLVTRVLLENIYYILYKSRTSNAFPVLQQSARKLLSPLCNTEHWRHFLSFFRIVPLGRALCMGWATGEVAAARRRRQWTVNLDPPGSITLKRIEASKNCRCFAQKYIISLVEFYPSICPKWFWTVQIVLVRYKSFWLVPNRFGRVQIILVRFKL